MFHVPIWMIPAGGIVYSGSTITIQWGKAIVTIKRKR
jgi:hypothetical protein